MSQQNYFNRLNIHVLGSLVKTFIGPHRRIKCVDDDGGCRYFRYASLMLEHLDIEHPVYQYIISVSSEYRKQHGERAADDLLYFIHAWSRTMVDLIDMGIPRSAVSYHMKAVINDCIQHIETKRIQITEVSQTFNTSRIDYCAVPTNEVCNSIVDDLPSQKQTDRNQFSGISTTDVEDQQNSDFVTKQVTKSREKLKNMECDIDSHIEEFPYSFEYSNIKNEERRPSQHTKCLNNDDGIDVIHLEMKNISSEIETDDTAWFFDDIGSKENADAEIIEPVERPNEADTVGISKLSDDEGNSDDSGAILTDIEKLKGDIENDLRMLKDQKERMHKSNVKALREEDMKAVHELNTVVDEEFDSCFSVSDSEFDNCFEVNDLKRIRTNENDTQVESTSSSTFDEEEFKTIQFKCADTMVKETKTSVVNKNVQKDLDTLKCSSSERFFPAKSENCTSENKSQTGRKHCSENKIQNINALLESVGKGGKSDTCRGVASLKIHSRHLQETDIIEACQNRAPVETENKVHNEKCVGKNDDKGTLNESLQEHNIGIARGSSNEANELEDDKGYCHSEKGYSLTVEDKRSANPNEFRFRMPEKLPNSVDLKNINRILKDINCISRASTDSRSKRDQTSESPEQHAYSCLDVKNNLRIHEAHTDRIPQSEENHCKLKSLNVGYTGSIPESETQKPLNMQNSRMSKIFLRSRHMILDTELPIETHISDDPIVSEPFTQKDPGTYSTEKHDVKNLNSVSENHPFENTCQSDEVEDDKETIDRKTGRDEKTLEDIRKVVYGMNYDGNEDISNAVCDVVLKQSTDGKLRLNLELVACHSVTGTHQASEVINGVVVKVSLDTITLLQKLQGKQCRALLVNGDVSSTFKHKGYKPVKVKEFCTVEMFTNETGQSRGQKWRRDVTDALEKLSIDILLVKGTVSEDVVSLCRSLDIVTMDTIPYKQLVQLSEAAQVDMVTYVTLATEKNVCTGMSVSPWQQVWCDKISTWNFKEEVVISLAGDNPQTVLLSSSAAVLADIKEQELWDCLHHVTSMLHCGYLVPGAGQTEEDCSRFLEDELEILKTDQNSVWNQELQMKQLVVECVISSFNSYVQLFRDCEVTLGRALEGFSSKVETWKTAIDVVITVNNIDSLISTGLTEEATNDGTL